MMKARLLVVDDDAEMRLTLKDILEETGYEVSSAANGADAIAHVAAARPDVVLLDLMMPIMDGWQVIEELKRRALPVGPIVVMSASQGELPAGAAAACRKPFDLDVLLATLEAVLR